MANEFKFDISIYMFYTCVYIVRVLYLVVMFFHQYTNYNKSISKTRSLETTGIARVFHRSLSQLNFCLPGTSYL